MNNYEKIWSRFHLLFENHRIPQASLLIGELNSPALNLLLKISQLIICKSSQAPCQKCVDCQLVEASNHPDILKIKPETPNSIIKIETIRELQYSAYLFPQRANYRLIIIEAAEKMNNASANALLKILEEPPAHTVFILLAQQTKTLLPTILSRCHVYSSSSIKHSHNNELDILDNYPIDSEKRHILEESEGLLEYLIAIAEKKCHPCELASHWSKYSLNILLWFLYLVYAQIQTMLINKEYAKGTCEKQLNQLSQLLDSHLIFKQLDKITVLNKKLSRGINVNTTLALEDLLFDL